MKDINRTNHNEIINDVYQHANISSDNEELPSHNSFDSGLSLSDLSDSSHHRQRSATTLEPISLFPKLKTTPISISDPSLSTSSASTEPAELLPRFIERCKSSMKIYKLPNSNEALQHLCVDDQDIKDQWQKVLDFYHNQRQCDDYQRIQDEIYQCFHVLANDNRDIMTGLDSIASYKDLLITSMRISIEPQLKLEIRIALGGTSSEITMRTPSYAIAGINLLQQLLQLRNKFQSHPSVSEVIPTIMLTNPPLLTFFSAFNAAVKVNHLDPSVGKQRAQEMLLYIKKYIGCYHSNVSQYVRYEMDHPNTYDEKLVERIMQHFVDDFKDDETKRILSHGAISHSSDEQGSIQYASMHLIIFKDIIDRTWPHTSFYSLDEDENTKMANEPICLYDCIITIGGPVEVRFNKVRYSMREAFKSKTAKDHEDNYYFCQSIRMLSKAGHTPVYYHHDPPEITVDEILTSDINGSKLTDKIYKDIKEDLSILRDDLGISIMKSIWTQISTLGMDDVLSWKNTVLTLIKLFYKAWQGHTKSENRTCQCLVENRSAIDQIVEHYNLSSNLNDNQRLIVSCILHELEEERGFPFGTIKVGRRLHMICEDNNTIIGVIHKLNDVLGDILLKFIRTECV